MNVEIGAEAAQFPEKEYINGIFFAVWHYWRWKLQKACRTAWPIKKLRCFEQHSTHAAEIHFMYYMSYVIKSPEVETFHFSLSYFLLLR